MTNILVCPICQIELQVADENNKKAGDASYYSCPRCGKFGVSRSLQSTLPKLMENKDKALLLSHVLRKMQTRKEMPFLNAYTIEPLLKMELPSLPEQTDNLLLWLGDNSIPGHEVHQTLEVIQAIVGARTLQNVIFVIDYLKRLGLLEKNVSGETAFIQVNLGFLTERPAL